MKRERGYSRSFLSPVEERPVKAASASPNEGAGGEVQGTAAWQPVPGAGRSEAAQTGAGGVAAVETAGRTAASEPDPVSVGTTEKRAAGAPEQRQVAAPSAEKAGGASQRPLGRAVETAARATNAGAADAVETLAVEKGAGTLPGEILGAELGFPERGGVWPPASGALEGVPQEPAAREEGPVTDEACLAAAEAAAVQEAPVGFDPTSWQPGAAGESRAVSGNRAAPVEFDPTSWQPGAAGESRAVSGNRAAPVEFDPTSWQPSAAGESRTASGSSAAPVGFDPMSWRPDGMSGGVAETSTSAAEPVDIQLPGEEAAPAASTMGPSSELERPDEAVPTVSPAPETDELRPTPEEEYLAFAENFPAQGQLKVQAFTARRTYPVSGAKVEVSKEFPDGTYIINTQFTDGSGSTETISLPAQQAALSEQPGDSQPYTTYDVTVSHPQYATVKVNGVSIFEGVLSLQKVDMMPCCILPDGGEEVEYNVGTSGL